MPRGIYKRSKEHRKLLIKFLKKARNSPKFKKRPDMCGKNNNSFSPEVREKIKLSKLGKPRFDMIGIKNPAKDIEVRIKISNALKGRNNTWGDKISKTMHLRGTTKGKNNGHWINGFGREPYPFSFNDKLKAQIRKRDSYTCQECSMTEEEHKKKYNEKLHVHHIDYNKKNCKEDNLISLCHRCHILTTNGNRDYWYAYFTYIMENR